MGSVVFKNVVKNFGALNVLRSLDLAVPDHKFLALLGPSGCGKTTALRILAGLDMPTAGKVFIGERDVTRLQPRDRDIAMVFQSYALYPQMTVAENIGYPLWIRGTSEAERKAKIGEVAAILEIGHLLDRRPRQLSGGQRQRVALARALVMRPKVLLLDEPLSALDKKLREQMQVELRRLQQAVGITFVLVTHDQYEALAMSDRIAVMFGGRIAQVASPKEIYQRPVNRQVADFLGGMNFVKAEIVEENGASLVVDTLGFGRVKTDKPKAFVRNGGAATLGIRPERLRVLWDNASAKFEVAGKVVERHYFGEITHLIVEIPGLEKPLSVTETNDFGADDIPVGAPIRLAYDPDALVAMAD